MMDDVDPFSFPLQMHDDQKFDGILNGQQKNPSWELEIWIDVFITHQRVQNWKIIVIFWLKQKKTFFPLRNWIKICYGF